MPTYQNSTAGSISYNGTTWAPGDTKAVDLFVPDEAGLTKTSDTPKVKSPTLASGVLEFADENDPAQRLYVPDCNAFLASIVVKTGSVAIRENYDDNAVEIAASPSNAFREAARRTEVEAFYITPQAAAVVAYNVSRMS